MYQGEATALAKIILLNAQLAVPFSLLNQRFSLNSQYLLQMSNTPLTSQDQFAIDNRRSVRGFDDQRTLKANEVWPLHWATPLPRFGIISEAHLATAELDVADIFTPNMTRSS